jgi:hypothetical protein
MARMDEKPTSIAPIRLEVLRNGRTAYMLGVPGFGSIEVGIGAATSDLHSPIFLGLTVLHREDESWQWANTWAAIWLGTTLGFWRSFGD